jgi:predicted dehydrogenase
VLVGCGARGESHAQGLLANPDRFELVALCDRDAERVGTLARKLGISRCYSDAEAMLAAERPALLCFATPPAVRLELVELGVRHGVGAIAFEKPLALSDDAAVARALRGRREGRWSATSSSTRVTGGA